MDARNFITIGMTAERFYTVAHERTVQHFVPSMPAVYATPMMILDMELTAGDAVTPHLPDGFVTVGTMVDIRHLAATPIGRVVRTVATVTDIHRKVITFDVAAFDGERKIGDGRHGRGVVNTADFKIRFDVI